MLIPLPVGSRRSHNIVFDQSWSDLGQDDPILRADAYRVRPAFSRSSAKFWMKADTFGDLDRNLNLDQLWCEFDAICQV